MQNLRKAKALSPCVKLCFFFFFSEEGFPLALVIMARNCFHHIIQLAPWITGYGLELST